jgi:hypothetical protein
MVSRTPTGTSRREREDEESVRPPPVATRRAVHQAPGNPTEVGDCREGADVVVVVIVIDDLWGLGMLALFAMGRRRDDGWRGRGDFFMREERELRISYDMTRVVLCVVFFAASGVKTDFSTSSYVEKIVTMKKTKNTRFFVLKGQCSFWNTARAVFQKEHKFWN